MIYRNLPWPKSPLIRTLAVLIAFAGIFLLLTMAIRGKDVSRKKTDILQTAKVEKTQLPVTVQPSADATAPLVPIANPEALRSSETKIPSMIELNIFDARLDLVLSGLDQPWAFEFISDSEVLITEISGKLSRYDLLSKKLTTIEGVPRTSAGLVQSGLLDVALHPDFARNHRIYLSYTISDEKTGKFHLTAVGSGVLEDNHLVDFKRIFSAEPFTWSPSNFGGALEFDNQGYLYVAIGDRSEHSFAQQGNRLQGKILRLKDDGSIPADNPFISIEGVNPAIYAFGVRNPQGLYFDRFSGRLFEAEHGPMGGDEVNIILRGGNYGWPDSSYGMNYLDIGLGEVGQAGTHAGGMLQPLWYYLPSRGISKIAIYRGAMFPEWDGDLLVTALRGRSISKLDLDGSVIRSEYRMLPELEDRIRDIKIAGDGSIYILGQQGNLFRLHRPPAPPTPEINKGKMIYTVVCAHCHDTGAEGAPTLSNGVAWLKIEKQARDLIYKHAIEGYRLMPERGLCTICSDHHIKTTVDYMLEQVHSSSAGANDSAPAK